MVRIECSSNSAFPSIDNLRDYSFAQCVYPDKYPCTQERNRENGRAVRNSQRTFSCAAHAYCAAARATVGSAEQPYRELKLRLGPRGRKSQPVWPFQL